MSNLFIIAFTITYFLAVYIIYKKELIGVYFIIIYMLMSTLNISGIFLKKIPFYNTKVLNALLSILLIITLIKFFRKKINIINFIFLFILILNIISMFRGIYLGYSSITISSEMELYLPFIIMFFYVYNCDIKNIDKIFNILKYVSIFLIFIAIMRTIALNFGINVYQDLDGRVLYATDVSIISLVSIYEFYKGNNKRGILFIIAIILLRHRTIWISLAIGFLIYFLLNKKITIIKIYLISLILVLLAAFNIYCNPNFNNKISVEIKNSVNEMFSENSTFQWRVKSVKFLISKDYMENNLNIIIGKPYGSGYRRYQGEMYRNEPAHDNYVEIYNRVGVLGLVLNLIIYLYIIYKSWKNLRIKFVLPYIIIIMLYYITYSGNIWQAIFLGNLLNFCDYKSEV